MNLRSGLVATALAGLALAGCTPEPKEPETTVVPVQPPAPPAPDFNTDSAYAFVAEQVAFGPRVPGSKAHKACGDRLVAKLEGYGAKVIQQTGTVTAYNGQPVPLRNIIASWRPEAKERLLLMAHWDTRPFADKDTQRQSDPIDGANDGASGVGIWLEVARHLNDLPSGMGIDLFLTDVEDMGEPNGAMGADAGNSIKSWCLGSQYWVKNPHVPGYKARYGILLDMVGANGSVFPREAWSMRYASAVVNKVWRKAADLGFGDRFPLDVQQHVGIDDHVIVNQGLNIPCIDIIAYDENTRAFPKSWHTHADNMQDISKETLEAVGTTVLNVVWSER
ncbi:MAG TPA: M28 family peptidase [Flavobacteriales bacterium]